jgi:hypothetical protein
MRRGQRNRPAAVALVVLLVAVLALAFERHPESIGFGGQAAHGWNTDSSTVTERLLVSDASVALLPHWGCVVRYIPWRIERYSPSDNPQIVWTVSRLNGPPWVWHHVTEAALDHDRLQVELCDWIVAPGTTHYSVSGVIEVANVSKRTGGTSPPGKASLTVQVPTA